MKWLKTLQRNFISFSIYFILILIAVNGILDLSNRRFQKAHEDLMDEAVDLEGAMNSILNVLKNSDLGFRGFYIIPNEQLLHPFTDAVKTFPEHIAKARAILKNQGLNPNRLEPVEKAYSDYFTLMDKMVEWRKNGNTEAIDEVIAGDPGYGVWEVYQGLKDQLDVDMGKIILESQARSNQVMLISTAVRISLVVLGIPTLLIVLFRLKEERKRRLKLFRELDQNNRTYLFDANEQHKVSLDEKNIIENLILNLRKASAFISSIAKGNFEVSWEGLNEDNIEANKDNLAGELFQMREQMIKVREEDKVRLWSTEGESRFSELVRQNQNDVQSLSNVVTSEIVKYLGANQASIFFVEGSENEEVLLKLYGCYAYDRKKFLEKTIAPGQGLVGQTYLEKEIIHLTDIPQNYIRITSGLGESTPGSLLIVPLKVNERVEGILEIASFKQFREHELYFLNKVGTIIASAIITLRSSREMRSLMENLQNQSEEMKSQEEEMRQNMEELQATQEEMSRKAQEYQELIAMKDESLEEKMKMIKALQGQLEYMKG